MQPAPTTPTAPRSSPLIHLALLLASAAMAGTLWPAVRLTLGAALGDSFDSVVQVLLVTLGLGVAAVILVLLGWDRGTSSTRATTLVLGLVAAAASVFELFIFFLGGMSGR